MSDEISITETGLSHNNRPLCQFVLVTFLLFLFNSLNLNLVGYIVISLENTLYLLRIDFSYVASASAWIPFKYFFRLIVLIQL